MLRFLLQGLCGFASIIGGIVLPVTINRKTDNVLLAGGVFVLEILFGAFFPKAIGIEAVDLLTHPLNALALWVLILIILSDGLFVPRIGGKARRKKEAEEKVAKEKALIENEAAELAKEATLDYLQDLNNGPSYTFLVSENDPGEEADRLFSQAKRGDPVKILYDKTREQYYLKFPFMDYYGHKLQELDYEGLKDRLLFVFGNGAGMVGMKAKRYLQIAAFEPRDQKIKFYEIVGEEDPCDRIIGSTRLKDIGKVSEGKEKRLLEEAGEWFLRCHIKGERKEKDADGKEVINVLDDKVEIHEPEKAGVIVNKNHFYGYIIYPFDPSGLLLDTYAHTEGKDVGLVVRYDRNDGITEIHNEKARFSVKGSESTEVFDTTFTYKLGWRGRL